MCIRDRMYSAHKAAGGMTSVYRQIGIGCQRVFQRILVDQLGLSEEGASWKYQVRTQEGKAHTLYLDGGILLDEVRDEERKRRLREWMEGAGKYLKIDHGILAALQGIVFEVRQGYKSKDSKRQNADIANASMAYTQSRMPVVFLLSNQIDADVARRYEEQRWIILRGSTSGSPFVSSYVFCRDVIGYDLAGFFKSNSEKFKREIDVVLRMLLSP